ncbi:MAG: phosphodiesterase [Tissierella sp.]|nr:phosphodiesterase [Tissierella sp.]
MKLFFISDIHGSVYYLNEAMERYSAEGADYIVILGDILYHGARNPLPKDYNPKGVIEILNSYSDKIIAVRGNCDSEVDEMVLNFPIMSTYSNILYNGIRLFLTHGHIYNENNMVDLKEGSAFIYGHTHILRAEKKENIYFLNPGSITLPKENNPHTYGILEDLSFKIKDLDGNIIKEIDLV